MKKEFILWFKELSIKNVPDVGGKNASLGEMYRFLTPKGVKIPNGFATTSYAYWYFLEKTDIKKKIKEILNGLDTHNLRDLARRGQLVRKTILEVEIPQELKKAILDAYHELSKQYNVKFVDTAVRSSATAEDLPTASFAGQQESYLNVYGDQEILKAVKNCVASLFTNRAISYRVDQGFDHFKIALSVGVQKMVRSDLACSGVMFSCDTESGFADATLIDSSYGLGENIVKGRVTPDEYYVFEPTLLKGYKAIISRRLGTKEWKLIYSNNPRVPTKNVKVPINDQHRFALTDEEVLILARWSVIIEKHYKRPMDIEWAKDGRADILYIVQARPETVKSQRNINILEEYKISTGKKKLLVEGVSVGSKIGQGIAHIIKKVEQISEFKKGEVLVTKMTDPDWEPIMKMASAIVTNSGGRTCHAAIVSRELGVPCVVGTENSTENIKNKSKITVSCAEGEKGYIYDGLVPYKIIKTNIGKIKRPGTKIMMNVGEPEQAFGFSFIPNDGVGLAREEFIINNYIKIHPWALLNYKSLKDKNVKKKIDELTVGYKNKVDFYVDRLADGIARIAAAFYPKEVILRFSDFKTNEYANLIGGRGFEPQESNPMIGWRGASRYYDPKFEPCFALECKAIKKVREIYGLDNLTVMVPFCRTIEEGKKVLATMEKYGLYQRKVIKGLKPLKVYVMCEIPSNVILAEEFCKIFDGFSIGSNDLTQLTLGVDRDSSLVAHIYNERNEAVKTLLRQVIRIAKANKRKVGICGQAPSDFPDFAAFLVKEGIDSISLTPDTVIKTTLMLNKIRK
ncbi:MAG: phosphoenolpyruvate synthase [Patescibacteria group bacterium]